MKKYQVLPYIYDILVGLGAKENKEGKALLKAEMISSKLLKVQQR